ncbi:MAG: DUF1475 family protein [Acidobacteriota bacterium]
MRNLLIAFFSFVILGMLYVTVTASLQEDVLTGGAALWPDPWFRATLADAYFGFLTFYAWLAYRESSWLSRGIWLVAILLLGNFAMAGYALWRLSQWKEEDGAAALLLRPGS